MSLSFEEKVEQLQQELDNVTNSLDKQDKCMPFAVIGAAITPFAIAVALYFMSPRFVTKQQNGKSVRSAGKIFQYTIILTVVVWIILFAILYGCGYSSSLLCWIK